MYEDIDGLASSCHQRVAKIVSARKGVHSSVYHVRFWLLYSGCLPMHDVVGVRQERGNEKHGKANEAAAAQRRQLSACAANPKGCTVSVVGLLRRSCGCANDKTRKATEPRSLRHS